MTGSRAANSTARFAPANHLGTGPFDAALRAAVRERGLTLDRLRSHLARRGIRIGLSSLSDWQHGRSRPGSPNSLQAIWALEEILGLRHASLVDLLATAASDHPAQGGGIDERSSPIADLLQDLAATHEDLDIISRQYTVWMNENGQAARSHCRQVVRARHDGVDRYPLRFWGEPGCELDRVRLGALENCRLGLVRRHPSQPVMVAELLFDETLAAGETWVFEAEILDGSGNQCTDVGHGFAQPEEHYVMELRFHPAALPVDCHVYRRAGLRSERIRTADLTLSAGNSVHLVASGLREGVLGIAWRWE